MAVGKIAASAPHDPGNAIQNAAALDLLVKAAEHTEGRNGKRHVDDI